MAGCSDSETETPWRRTPSCARERSRSSVPTSADVASGQTDPQRGEAPEVAAPEEPRPTQWWEDAAATGRGRGSSGSRSFSSKGGKRGKGKYTAFAGRGGKGWGQRGAAPATTDPADDETAATAAKGKGKSKERLQEGEILRCVWPAAPSEVFAPEGRYSLDDVLQTADALNAKVEIRGRQRKNAPLQRILILTAPPGEADGLFLFLRSVARINNRHIKLPKLVHCTRAEINMHGVLVQSLRGGQTPADQSADDRWLEFMKQPLPHDFSSDSDLPEEQEQDTAARTPTPAARSAGSAAPQEPPRPQEAKREAQEAATPAASAQPHQSPRGEAPGLRRGEAPDDALSASTASGAARAAEMPQSGAAQQPPNLPHAEPLGPPMAATTEPASVLLPQEETERLPQETFEDAARTPKPLFLSDALTLAFHTCKRFVEDCCTCCFAFCSRP